MKILVFGNGQLGQELNFLAEQDSKLTLVVYDFPEADISSLTNVTTISKKEAPQFIVNAAAYTAVDKAENDEATAFEVNAIGPQNLALTCKDLDIPLIHVSTDYIFDGESTQPYQISDIPNPQSAYGRTKLAGEWAIQSTWPKHYIFRTAWVYSVFGNNFVKTMLRLGAERDELGIVADQIGSPTNARDLASAILQTIQNSTNSSSHFGTYHYTNKGSCSWHDFACEIFKIAKTKGLKTPKRVKGIRTEDFPVLAKRPSYSVMSLDKCKDLNLKMIDWKESLYNFFKEPK